jgi:hypothetical protein
VRVWRAAGPAEVAELPEYEGCRSWVRLRDALPTEGAAQVLPEPKLEDLRRSLDLLLNPTALA